MAPHDHEFDFLNEWAHWPDNKIEEIISNSTIAALQSAVYLLVDESQRTKFVVTADNFVTVVREMRGIYKSGSRALGKAIIEASEYVDQNEVQEARKTYEQFLSRCESPFYRRIAEQQLRKL
jgi:hypothetical protein